MAFGSMPSFVGGRVGSFPAWRTGKSPLVCGNRRSSLVAAVRKLDELQVGELLQGVVVESGASNCAWLDCGVVRTGKKGVLVPVKARLRADPVTGKCEEVGRSMMVEVKKPQNFNGRLEVVRLRKNSERRKVERALEDLEVGEELQGTVLYLFPGGALLDVGVDRKGRYGRRKGMEALLRRCDFHPSWTSDADLVMKQGQKVIKLSSEVTVYVRQVVVENGHVRVGGEYKPPSQIAEEIEARRKESRARKRKSLRNAPAIGSKRTGKVVKQLKYGIIVDINRKSSGLLHWSKIGEENKLNWRETFPIGSKVDVTVESVRENGDIELKHVPNSSAESASPALKRSSSKVQIQGATPSEGEDSAPEAAEDDDEYEDEDDDNYEDFDDDPFDDDYFEDKYG